MTDKITECKHFVKSTKKCSIDLVGCNNHRIDCYFKQLKRKERECGEINLTNERLVVEKYTLNEEILKYKQALDEIKEYCNQMMVSTHIKEDILNIIDRIKQNLY